MFFKEEKEKAPGGKGKENVPERIIEEKMADFFQNLTNDLNNETVRTSK